MKEQRGLTSLPGVPDRAQALPGMAYFAGTGPWDKTCGTCAHRGATGRCSMYRRLTGRHGPPVQRNWKACKYYDQTARAL